MTSRINRFVSVLILMVYGTLALVSVPFHFHDADLLATGSGVHAFAQHHDAADCHHHVIGSHDDCTVCSVVTHSVTTRNSYSAPIADDTAQGKPAVVQFAVEHDYHSTQSRRGPPVLFA